MQVDTGQQKSRLSRGASQARGLIVRRLGCKTAHSSAHIGQTINLSRLNKASSNSSAQEMSRATFDTFYNVIDGRLVSTASTRHGINPARLEKLAPVPVSTEQDVQAAVDAAKRAGPAWAATPLQDRRRQVERLADAIESQRDELANMLTLEQGKPVCFSSFRAIYFYISLHYSRCV